MLTDKYLEEELDKRLARAEQEKEGSKAWQKLIDYAAAAGASLAIKRLNHE